MNKENTKTTENGLYFLVNNGDLQKWCIAYRLSEKAEDIIKITGYTKEKAEELKKQADLYQLIKSKGELTEETNMLLDAIIEKKVKQVIS